MLIKELQYKLEHNEGCKYQCLSRSLKKIHSRDQSLRSMTEPCSIKNTFSDTLSQMNKNLSSLCLVIVMRTTADDIEDGSSCTSCVVDSLIENETNQTVGVNNCVNIVSESRDDESNLLNNMPIYECIAAGLDDDDDGATSHSIDDNARKIDDEILNNFLFNDDALTSSKYSDVTSRCDLLQPSTSSTATARSNDVVVSRYASTRDNNRKHQKAVRKNFSLWIGVTSCVWGLLLLLMKNYVD